MFLIYTLSVPPITSQVILVSSCYLVETFTHVIRCVTFKTMTAKTDGQTKTEVKDCIHVLTYWLDMLIIGILFCVKYVILRNTYVAVQL